MNNPSEYILDHVFDAPRDLVWRSWTDPELVKEWYGPGIETIIHGFDLKPGGAWLNEMKWGGKSDFSKMTFQEVLAREKLVWHHCSTDQDWNVQSNQMMPDWPRTLLTTVTFTADGDKTNVRLSQVPIDATDAEIACFTNMMAGMGKGWGSGFAIIEKILTEMEK
ncbi:MAG: hypothetical protein ACI861_002540 [Paracoccaceae bacterium]|jgi:uncharacterized protein YndB with AHSA1/START domain